jgi:hypothetical protein
MADALRHSAEIGFLRRLASVAAFWSIWRTRTSARFANFRALVCLSAAFASAAATFLSMNEPSFGSSPSGHSSLDFSRSRQSRAVRQAGSVVVVAPSPGAVVVVTVVELPGAPLVDVVVEFPTGMVAVVLVDADGLATRAKGDSELTVRHA